jgi:hypothetical protein
MKKKLALTITVIAIIFLATLSHAQTWYTANQSTLGWDSVTTVSNGDPLPVGDVLKYRVYRKNAVTGGTPTVVSPAGDIVVNEFTITLDTEGSYFVGVSAVRYDSSGAEIGESSLAWSDDPIYCANGEDFGIRYYFLPGNPVGLRRR